MEESRKLHLLKTKVGVHLSKMNGHLKNFKPWRKPKFWRKLSAAMLVVMVLTVGGISLYISSLDISKLQTPLAHPSYLYDQKDNRISQLSSSRIEPVSGEQIPLIMKEALIAVEDRRFYEHQGVDLRSITILVQQVALNLLEYSVKSYLEL